MTGSGSPSSNNNHGGALRHRQGPVNDNEEEEVSLLNPTNRSSGANDMPVQGAPTPSRQHGSGAAARCSTFLGRENLLVLIAGVAIGYLVLPFVLVQYVGQDTMMLHQQGSISSAKPSTLSSENLSWQPEPVEAEEPDEVVYNVRGGRSATTGGPPDVSHVVAEMAMQYKILSTRSTPTDTTPQVMQTQKLPDALRKRILVTGGTGFVGSHLVDKLMMEGHEVVVVDNFFTGSKRNVEHWLQHPNFSLVVHDVINPIMLEVDQIYHLACPASPPHYQYNPVKTIKTSTMGTINMLGLAKRVKARVLLASTSEIYGDPLQHPQKETYWGNVNTVGPRSCYDEGKRVAETMMYSYRDQSDVEVRVARIFNTFGPRMHPNDGRVVSNFIIQSLQNRDITVYGDGSQTRSFQYVSDLVEGLYALMNGDYDMPVNVGNPEEYSVKQFAEYIKSLTKSESKVNFLPAVKDDPSQRQPDISTAKEKLGWEPKVKVEDGLARTIDYFRRVLNESGEIIPTGPGAAKPVA